jgi:hypothetical protein
MSSGIRDLALLSPSHRAASGARKSKRGRIAAAIRARPRTCENPLYRSRPANVRGVILYTCPAQTHGADAPLVKHPCGVAAKALEQSGFQFETRVVGGFKMIPFSRRGRRDEILELTGQEDVPVLLLDDGEFVQGSQRIVAWAEANRA